MKRNFATAMTCLLVVLGVCLGCADSATPEATRTSATSVAGNYPHDGCSITKTEPVLTEQCGPCLVLAFTSAAYRDKVLHAVGDATPGGAWFAVGKTWLAADKQTSFTGAIDCQQRYGGFLARYTN